MKVAAINDLSGFGKCSQTADMTVLAAMGIECCPLPTAVLSAQTGYPSFYSKDLTGIIPEYLREWKKQNEIFDGVITGFMMSSLQASNSLEFIRAFKSKNSKILVDPVMGDDGKAYSTYTGEMCKRMSELVAVADVITPNLTEAAILLGESFPDKPISVQTAKDWLVRLSQKGATTVVITSVKLEGEGMATVGYDSCANTFWKINNVLVPAQYSGTGDMFASVLIGGLLGGEELAVAMNRATEFTEHTVIRTYQNKNPWRDGLLFEGAELAWLTKPHRFSDCKKM